MVLAYQPMLGSWSIPLDPSKALVVLSTLNVAGRNSQQFATQKDGAGDVSSYGLAIVPLRLEPLVILKIAICTWHVEVVDLPIQDGGSFQFEM